MNELGRKPGCGPDLRKAVECTTKAAEDIREIIIDLPEVLSNLSQKSAAINALAWAEECRKYAASLIASGDEIISPDLSRLHGGAKAALQPFDSSCVSPKLLPGLPKAIARLTQTINSIEKHYPSLKVKQGVPAKPFRFSLDLK